MNPSITNMNAASPVAQINQGRDGGLGRGPPSINVLRSPPPKKGSLGILQCNINGLSTPAMRTKLDQLIEMAENYGAQIIALQETKLRELSDIKLKNYSIYRLDRPHRGGGGLAFLIGSINYQKISMTLRDSDLEIQGISITWKRRTYKIFNMYHPPNQEHLSVEFFDFADKNTIFLGDLNAKHSSWGCSTNNSRGCDLLDAADDRAFIFLNNGSPTHTSFSYSTSEALDITFVSPELHHKFYLL